MQHLASKTHDNASQAQDHIKGSHDGSRTGTDLEANGETDTDGVSDPVRRTALVGGLRVHDTTSRRTRSFAALKLRLKM